MVGVVVILVGLASVMSNIARAAFGTQAGTLAFAPVALLGQVGNTPGSVSSAALEASALAPALATTTPLVPARLLVPSLGINAAVEQVGKKADGSMATPQTFGDVAWYALGSKPGDAGTAVIAGHVNNALTIAGVFEHLSQINIGDTVVVSDVYGRSLTYIVDETDAYPSDNAPTAKIFQSFGSSTLVLITCDGQWDAAAHSFDKRFVVYAHLSATQPQ